MRRVLAVPLLALLASGCAHHLKGLSAAAQALDCPEEQVTPGSAPRARWGTAIEDEPASASYSGCGRVVSCRPEERHVRVPSGAAILLVPIWLPIVAWEATRELSDVCTTPAGTRPLAGPVPDRPSIDTPEVRSRMWLLERSKARELARLRAKRESAAVPMPDADLAETLALAERDQQWPEAKEKYRRFALASNDARTRLNFATWLWTHDFNEEALTEAREAKTMEPLLPGLHARLSQILAANGQLVEAAREEALAAQEAPPRP